MSGDVEVLGRSRNVVVTGAAGFIGRHLVEALRGDGVDVVGIDRRDNWNDREIERTEDRGYLRAVHGDLVHMDLAALLRGAGAVFHLAALPGVRPSWTRFPEYLHCNVLATQRLLEACVRAGVGRVVLASSSSVYGGTTGVGESGVGAMGEEQVPCPLSPYGVTKLAAERLALAFAARDDAALAVRALRFFTVYGPGQRPDMFISRLIRATLTGAPIQIYGDGTQLRDFVHVSDVVRALCLAGRAGGGSDVLNIGTGSPVTVNEVLALTGELTGLAPDARYGPARIGDVGVTAADTTRARDRLGFSSAVDLRTGLTAQIEWTRGALAPAGAQAALDTASASGS
ncbi:NAD-dependent epimerase/dehydratase family protein [Streptomyces yaizuensis]|uniref:NAD-dependent epimerase/dehydratase family protein n=1 Tax=Streptomyces yaizuensis TaxID=2989713 RepID=A0ABQ5NQU4_9ACTN|nr:NAD-dependent epimerase/dehydratase family protein [Streptomyces sp. YSPA8]GLF92732.1 NAD-dependent epimerase/dehydratase family protein [Streptomyces sp. YSPA8]